MPYSAQPFDARNQLLTALPADLQAQLWPKLHRVKLTLHENLIVPDKPIEALYFVESGFVSLVATLEDGAQAEVGLVGREGLVGLPLIAGVDSAFEEAYVQVEGTALQMPAGAFRQTLKDNPVMQSLLSRYSEAMRAQSIQTAACNGRHGLERRLARWLLMAQDRVEGNDLPIIQELLAIMLCVHRPSITVAAGVLQSAGIIRYRRGHITVLDRAALEAASCDCYNLVQKRFRCLLGP
jgi:CRP-like cAMP-binding protein